MGWFERMRPYLAADVSRNLEHGRTEKRTVLVSENLTLIDAVRG